MLANYLHGYVCLTINLLRNSVFFACRSFLSNQALFVIAKTLVLPFKQILKICLFESFENFGLLRKGKFYISYCRIGLDIFLHMKCFNNFLRPSLILVDTLQEYVQIYFPSNKHSRQGRLCVSFVYLLQEAI